ncbi:MAG: hypothetical protein FWG18_01155 [Alphaproteobacteria bacterium]|nr:hypothetical protein [Alphaproteobacteria bacterium]
MKKLLTLFAVFGIFTTAALAEMPGKGFKDNMTAEQKAEWKAKKEKMGDKKAEWKDKMESMTDEEKAEWKEKKAGWDKDRGDKSAEWKDKKGEWKDRAKSEGERVKYDADVAKEKIHDEVNAAEIEAAKPAPTTDEAKPGFWGKMFGKK